VPDVGAERYFVWLRVLELDSARSPAVYWHRVLVSVPDQPARQVPECWLRERAVGVESSEVLESGFPGAWRVGQLSEPHGLQV